MGCICSLRKSSIVYLSRKLKLKFSILFKININFNSLDRCTRFAETANVKKIYITEWSNFFRLHSRIAAALQEQTIQLVQAIACPHVT